MEDNEHELLTDGRRILFVSKIYLLMFRTVSPAGRFDLTEDHIYYGLLIQLTDPIIELDRWTSYEKILKLVYDFPINVSMNN